jgi:hypothetical protein
MNYDKNDDLHDDNDDPNDGLDDSCQDDNEDWPDYTPRKGPYNPYGSYGPSWSRKEEPDISSELLKALLLAHKREIATLKESHRKTVEFMEKQHRK